MERWNSEGIRRDDLSWALSSKHIVPNYRKIDSCMLCRAKGVNEAGLCQICYAMLEPPELQLAERWMNGQGP